MGIGTGTSTEMGTLLGMRTSTDVNTDTGTVRVRVQA